MLLTLTTCIHGLSALTRVFVIAPVVFATVSQDMKVLLANVLFVQTTVMTVALAGQKSFLPLKLVEHTLLLGML